MIYENTFNVKQDKINHAIKTIVATLGVIFGISGIGHGFFEALQGNVATNGYFINAIGEANKMWLLGNEPAFTLIPNFMATGIASIMTGIIIIVWSVFFMHKKHAATIFLLLFVLLFLVGGGIAQVVFFVIGWAMATSIHKPLYLWRKALPFRIRKHLAKLWLPLLTVSALLILYTLQVAIFGFVPGLSDPNNILAVMLCMLCLGLILLLVSFIAGCAHDIDNGGRIDG
jgi:hypothetical protein